MSIEFPPLSGNVLKPVSTAWNTAKTLAIIQKTAEPPPVEKKKKEKEREFLYLDELIFKEFNEREAMRRKMDRVDGDRDYWRYEREVKEAYYCSPYDPERDYLQRRSKLYEVWTGNGYVDEKGRVILEYRR